MDEHQQSGSIDDAPFGPDLRFVDTNAPTEWLRQNSENQNRNEKIVGNEVTVMEEVSRFGEEEALDFEAGYWEKRCCC